jgi:hypothetical protein
MIPDFKFTEAVKLAVNDRPFMCLPETYEGLTMLDGGPKPTLEEIETAWENRPPDAKRWMNAQEFLEEFTMYERGLIALSTNLDIAALRLTFSGWFSEIHADHDLLVQARFFLVSEGILTEDRAQAIFG